MSATPWTDQQRDAIRHVDGALLLSAAAGSGKTAVLAERCVHLVCDAPSPCEVDQLLVLTFTRAAAAEMRERIQRRLTERVLADTTGDERLHRQLRLLDRAAITTIDAFCADVVRGHFNVVGVDPAFSILASEDANLMQNDACEAVLEAEYDGPHADAFKALLDEYFDGDDAPLRAQILAAHRLLQSLVDPVAWTRDALARLTIGTRREPSPLARELIAILRRHLRAGRHALDAARETATREPKLAPYASHAAELAADLALREELLDDADLDPLADHVEAWTVPRMPTIRGEVPGKELVKDRIDAVKKSMKAGGPLREMFRARWSLLRDDLDRVRGRAATFFDLVARFESRYAGAKQAARALDFADTERLTLRILRDHDGRPTASVAAADYQRRFAHVLIDEFQDLNALQSEILRLVSRDRAAEASAATRSNLFAVGDVKQSIYRFRLAEPRLFVARDRLLRGPNPLGRVIDLQHNFRSRAPLLDAVNDVFRSLMTGESADIEYDETQALRAGAAYAPAEGVTTFAGKPIELRLVPKKVAAPAESDVDPAEATPPMDRFEREIETVARRIRELVCGLAETRPHVFARDGEGHTARPIRFGDVAVLLRSARFKSSIVADALRAHGVPVHSDDTTGFFVSTEVQDVLALLRVLSNRRQDIPFAALLRSPLARLDSPDRVLAMICIAYPDEPFHRAVPRFAAESRDASARHVDAFLRTLDRWRDEMRERSIVDALSRILMETHYRTFCVALPGGAQRVANLDELLRRASAFDAFERQGLDRFLRFLHELETDDQIGRPPVTQGSDDVVRVMTVHKSKGLEFPVVIVPDLGKKFNEASLSDPVLIDRDAGIGMTAVDLRKRIRYPSASSLVVRDHARRQMLAEEIRVLYVALTRAREHLILVGTGSEADVERWRDEWSAHDGPLPDAAVQSAHTMLDWLGPIAAMTGARGLGTFEVTVEASDAAADVEATPICAPGDARERLRDWLGDASSTPEPGDVDAAMAIRRLTFGYGHEPATRQAATAAVTDAVKAPTRTRRIDDDAFDFEVVDELDWPQAYRSNARLRANEVGSAVHRVLDRLDFRSPIERDEDVAALIAAMVERREVSEADARLVRAATIRWLASTSLGELIRAPGSRLLREQPLAISRLLEGGDADDRVLVRGRVDALVVRPEGVVLIDYKTDRVTPDDVLARAATYAPQLGAYAAALARIARRPVLRACAVFLTPRVIVDVDPTTGVPTIAEGDDA